MSTNSMSDIRIAVFGESGSGKTTLLSTFFGKQQSDTFLKENKYYISANSKAQGHILLQNYYGMEEGRFPPATFSSFEEYKFSVQIPELKQKQSELQITWIDYPGKWWTQDEVEKGAKEEQRKCLDSLLSAQVGILLVDGDKYHKEKEKYVRKLFEHFKNEFKRIERDTLQLGKTVAKGPETWLIALTKADLIPDFDATSFQKAVISSSGKQFQELASQLHCDSFGCKYLRLASVKTGSSGEIIDTNSTIGIDCIAPAALMMNLEEIQRIIAKKAEEKTFGQHVIAKLKDFISFLDTIDDFLPPKFQVITIILKALKVSELLDGKLEVVRERRDSYIKAGNVLGATIASMVAIFKLAKEKGIFSECQK